VPNEEGDAHVTVGGEWVCKVCWKRNRARDEACWRCKTPRGTTDEGEVARHRQVIEAKAAMPEPVPDLVVAVPVTVFRGYGKAWVRGGFALFGLLALIALGGVTDMGYLALTGSMGAGLIVCGLLAGEVSEGMRNREVWAYIAGIVLAVAGAIGSVFAFNALAPGLFSPTAVRWLSLIVFGGAGIAAGIGLFMVLRAQRKGPMPAVPPSDAAAPRAQNVATTGRIDDPGT